MGAYLYTTKPSATAKALIRYDDGREEVATVALYRYAYKPYRSFDTRAENHRMHVRSGAMANENAYRRAGREVPALGTYYTAEKGEKPTVYNAAQRGANGLFQTRGLVSGEDDHSFTNYVGRVIRWLELPKGVTEAEARPFMGE